MKTLLTILKVIGGLLIGGLIGFIFGGMIVLLFTDTTWSEYLDKYCSINFSEGIAVFIVAVLSLLISLAILVPIHELGHLICGLLSGYKFVSFRVYNYTLMKEGGHLHIKKFGIAGTGGQCLLNPPDLPFDKIPTGWYNFGGLLANIILFLIGLPFFFLDLNPFVAESLGVFLVTDLIMILLNGIPMQAGGVGNDGYNLKLLKNSPISKYGIINQLRANAMIQQGVRPKDMPNEWFTMPENIDYGNALEVSIPMMYSSRLLDNMKFDEALKVMETLYDHKDEIMPLYVKEIACELVFLYLRTGNNDAAERILDKNLRQYIESYRNMMSSKERILFAITLCLDKDEQKSNEIFNNFIARKNDYLLQGEVKSDVALMEDMRSQINNN